jgi:CheY-like chemotaxis protein
VGIATEELPWIFHAFEQAQLGRENGGTGLGLTITQNYVRLLGGEIAVQSEMGSGSVFSFWIRVAEAASQDESVEQSVPSIVRIPPGLPVPRILIVDDDRLNRQLLVRLLESVGFATREAGNGQEGFAAFLEWHPDLILMDLRMPLLSGCDAIRRIRASEGGDRVPIIAMTASVLDESRREAAQYGADELLLKPFRAETLLQMIKSRLNLAV